MLTLSPIRSVRITDSGVNLTADAPTVGEQSTTVESEFAPFLAYEGEDIDFGAIGEKEIYQNVKYIVLTPIKSVVLDREFGMDFSWVDKPIPIAELMLSQEAAMKIARYEPRCYFEEITYEGDGLQGELDASVKISIVNVNERPSLYSVTVDSGVSVTSAPNYTTKPTLGVEFDGNITGLPGPPGPAATIRVGVTYTGEPGTDASVVNVGNENNAVFDFTIPRGDKGDKGDTGDGGPAATIEVGITTTGEPGTNAKVVNVGDSSNAIFDFTIPRGDKGDKGDLGPQGYDGSLVGSIVLWPSEVVSDSWLACDGSEKDRLAYPDLYSILGDRYGAGDGSTTFNLPDFRGRVPVGLGQGTGLTNRLIGVNGGEESHVLTVAELAAHSHTATQGTHTHTVSDPATHAHTVPQHNHGLSDPMHQHPTYDPGHVHSTAFQNIGAAGGGSFGALVGPGGNVGVNTDARGTGVVADWTTTRCSIVAQAAFGTLGAGTGVSVVAISAGAISIGNTGDNAAHNTMPPYLVANYIIKALYTIPADLKSLLIKTLTELGIKI